jgi:hypothetical protein
MARSTCYICHNCAHGEQTDDEADLLALIYALRDSPDPVSRKRRILGQYHDYFVGAASHTVRYTREDVLAHGEHTLRQMATDGITEEQKQWAFKKSLEWADHGTVPRPDIGNTRSDLSRLGSLEWLPPRDKDDSL